jgi:carbonic anhydrase/acetyltransferase-like protein (isoleucine patch superfamily)
MICSEAKILGHNIDINAGVLIQPKASVIASDRTKSVFIGESNILEECVTIRDSTIGHSNLIEVGTLIEDSTIGDCNVISPKVSIKNSKIGNGCFIAATIKLDGVTIPDGTSVYLVQGKWRCKPVDISILRPSVDGYRDALTNADSAQSLGRNFQMHKDFTAI